MTSKPPLGPDTFHIYVCRACGREALFNLFNHYTAGRYCHAVNIERVEYVRARITK